MITDKNNVVIVTNSVCSDCEVYMWLDDSEELGFEI